MKLGSIYMYQRPKNNPRNRSQWFSPPKVVQDTKFSKQGVPHKAAITHQKLADLHFEVLKHLAYSPNLSPLVYFLFLNLEKRHKGRKF
jgi:hypothetical protein